MMYHMKCIVAHDPEDLELPKCMYQIKNPNRTLEVNECDLKICDQASSKNMTDLEKRQEDLLRKLDFLYNRIKNISALCISNTVTEEKLISLHRNKKKEQLIATPEEVVMVFGPDNLPWFWAVLKNLIPHVSLKWHIHSSVPAEKEDKIKSFMKIFHNNLNNSRVNVRLIFKNVSADSELKIKSLDVPIVGTVNILRYLSFVYPSEIPYDPEDYQLEALLDLCHKLERTPEKGRDIIVKKIFSDCKDWIYKDLYSIVDVAAYNVIKQWQNSGKNVPKGWMEKCNKLSSNKYQ